MALDDLPEFLTVEEAAQVLRIGRTSAYLLTQRWRHTRGAERSAGAAAGPSVAGAALGARADGCLTGRLGVTAPSEKPLNQWASTDVLAAVVDVEIAALLGRTPSKSEALLALAARRELEHRMRRHRWLAMETARKAGASWAEIAAAAGMEAPAARRLYEQTLARQKAFGHAEAHPADPGVPEL